MNTELFRKRLEEEKARLEEEMEGVGRKNPLVPNDYEPIPTETGTEADPADQAGLIESHEENVRLLADLEARYDEVLEALRRIAKGTYGVCRVCGKPIEKERLEADPAATTCISDRNTRQT